MAQPDASDRTPGLPDPRPQASGNAPAGGVRASVVGSSSAVEPGSAVEPAGAVVGTIAALWVLVAVGKRFAAILQAALLFASLLGLCRRLARVDAALDSTRGSTRGLALTVHHLSKHLQERERQRESGENGLRESHEMAALALVKTLMLHDPVTGSHLERLPVYTRLLATELARHPRHHGTLVPELVHILPRASTLHDVGKLGIPEYILRKSGRLTVDEFALMKRHTTVGGRTLQELARRDPRNLFFAVGGEIALYHHERWDGTGYPFGLRGARIPLVARIVALADVYDALTSERPYKPAYSHAATRRYIVEQSGAHFDPDVVEAFLACEQEFRRTHEAHPARAAVVPLALGA